MRNPPSTGRSPCTRSWPKISPPYPITVKAWPSISACWPSSLAKTGRTPQAEAKRRQALGIAEQLANHFPAVVDFRKDHVDWLIDLGDFLATTGRPREAEPFFRQALAQSEALVARYPGPAEYRYRAGVAAHSAAELLRDQKKYPEARTMVEQAIAHERAALNLSPGHPEYLHRLRMDLSLLAELLFSMGENAKAIEAIAEITRCVTDDGLSYYVTAAFSALWVDG